MATSIYLSTGAFPKQPLSATIDACQAAGIFYVELSSGTHADPSALAELRRRQADGFRFLVHNYFPAPAVPFVLNLASDRTEIATRSMEHCRTAITWCAALGSKTFSVHAGFCFHADPKHLGAQQTHLVRFDKQRAHENFVARVLELRDYAEKLGVAIAIENNVCSPINVCNAENELFLAVTTEETISLLDDLPNVGLLLDVAHLNVSANALHFSREEYISRLQDRIVGVHVSENDGLTDSNEPVTSDSWFWKPLLQIQEHLDFLVIEAYRLSPEVARQQYDLVTKVFRKEKEGYESRVVS